MTQHQFEALTKLDSEIAYVYLKKDDVIVKFGDVEIVLSPNGRYSIENAEVLYNEEDIA
jgi:hypothetical protein